MKQNKMTIQEKERLVQLLTTRFNIDELNELTNLLKKDKCKVEILLIQNVNQQHKLLSSFINDIKNVAPFFIKYKGNELVDIFIKKKQKNERIKRLYFV